MERGAYLHESHGFVLEARHEILFLVLRGVVHGHLQRPLNGHGKMCLGAL